MENEPHIYRTYIRYQTLALCQPAVFDLAGMGKGAYCRWVKLCVQGQRESVVGVGSEFVSETEAWVPCIMSL